ncbi:MAG TPA: TRAP transporter small permease [Dehalococcoidales bacterium]|nr:TRAP transporter small permease [Dehalococcoidales bacterium]
MRLTSFAILLEKGIRYIENGMVVICGVIFMFMLFMGTADVVGRYFLNYPVTGTFEISEKLMGAIVLLGWAYTQRTGGHVGLELFYNKFPLKMQTIVSLITQFLLLGLFTVIVKQSWQIALKAVSEGRHFLTLDWPTGPFYFLVPVGAFFLCLEFIIRIFQLVAEIRKK